MPTPAVWKASKKVGVRPRMGTQLKLKQQLIIPYFTLLQRFPNPQGDFPRGASLPNGAGKIICEKIRFVSPINSSFITEMI